MNELDYQKINERLGKLERRNRIIKQIGCVVVLIVAVSLLVGADKKTEIVKEINADIIKATEIWAQSITVADSKGNTGIRMATALNIASFIMFDDSNQVRLNMNTALGEVEMKLYDAKGNLRFMVITDEEMSSALSFFDSKGNRQVKLSSRVEHPTGFPDTVFSDYGGYMILSNKTGERVVQLCADENGNGVVRAYNRKGHFNELKPGF